MSVPIIARGGSSVTAAPGTNALRVVSTLRAQPPQVIPVISYIAMESDYLNLAHSASHIFVSSFLCRFCRVRSSSASGDLSP